MTTSRPRNAGLPLRNVYPICPRMPRRAFVIGRPCCNGSFRVPLRPSLRCDSCPATSRLQSIWVMASKTDNPAVTNEYLQRSFLAAYQSINPRRNSTIARSRRTNGDQAIARPFACGGLVAFEAEQKHRRQHSRDDSTHGRAAEKRLGRSRH
jgi:hypothetical protein